MSGALGAASPGPLRASVQLKASGEVATWELSTIREGAWVLSVGGAEQTCLVPGEPTELVYEYLVRVAAAIDLAAAATQPLRVLHLGGGGLSVPRYVEATRPGSEQVIVDLDAELMPFVLESFPLARPELSRVLIGDVRDMLPQALEDGPFDVTLLDISLGPGSPERLLEESFLRELLATLSPGGLLLINVGDEPPHEVTRRLAATLSAAGQSVWVTGQVDVLEGEYSGNLILGATRKRWDAARCERLRSRGPHPAGLLIGLELLSLGKP